MKESLFRILSWGRSRNRLLDVIIIPIGLFFLLYKLAILFTESLFGGARADKLERTLRKYFGKGQPYSFPCIGLQAIGYKAPAACP